MTEKFICIHGHFYQPPRENPWLEEVEFEESAHPYHDWNLRVTAECYAPNSASRIMDLEMRIIGLANNYSKISFNFGPTLLYWISRHKPDLYESILNADKESSKNYSGHGSAIAQAYNHIIMPLADKRDKETQVKWGIRDFEKRFNRFPEGMWLPETGVDIETLEVLAENNIKFTILAPHQAARVRKIGEKDWTDVTGSKIDPRRAYVCRLPSGKTINLFFFDKVKASEASFGDLLSNGEIFANKLMEGFNGYEDSAFALVNLASDGEVYGHHHPHGDMTLAYCLYYLESKNLAKTTNYAEFLNKHPPEFEVEIQENTSWSCLHGVERWRSDCGDNTGRPGWRQIWRKPLRDAMNWLRDEIAPRFENEAAKYLKDPWSARNSYIDFLSDRSKDNADRFLSEQAKKTLADDEKKQVLKLLEMQRQAMLMFTSCGWFFDEISGLETVQVMMYAARAMQLAQQVFGIELENQYVKMLEQAPSNIPEFENGAKTYLALVKRAVVDLAKIAAQGTILQLFSDETVEAVVGKQQQYGCCFMITNKELERHDAGKFRLVISNCIVQSAITLDAQTFVCVAIWLGDHNVSCGVKANADEELFKTIKKEISESFNKGEINETILLMPKHFGNSNYSLKDIFRDDQMRILDFILKDAVKKATDLNEIIYRDNLAFLKFMSEVGAPAPKTFWRAAEIVLNSEIRKLLTGEDLNVELLSKLISDAKALGVEFDSESISLEASERIALEFTKLHKTSMDARKLENINTLIETIRQLPVKLELWHAQNTAFSIVQEIYKPAKEKKDANAQTWISAFEKLCKSIGIKLD